MTVNREQLKDFPTLANASVTDSDFLHVSQNNVDYKVLASAFRILIANNLTTSATGKALDAAQGKELKRLIDYSTQANRLLFKYSEAWTVTATGTELAVEIPSGKIRLPNLAAYSVAADTGTLVNNAGITLTYTPGTNSFAYTFVTDLSTITEGETDYVYVICKNIDGELFTFNASLNEFIKAGIEEINYSDYISQPTPPTHQEGRQYYDGVRKAMAHYNEEAEIIIYDGQMTVFRVYNSSGSTITKGKVVYPAGATIGLADAYVKEKSRLIAVAGHDIENDSYGYVIRTGLLQGYDTSSYTQGATLYLDTDGNYTTTRPDDGGYPIIVGIVDVVDAVDGEITVDINISETTAEVNDNNGFPPSQLTECALSFDDGTRTFSITLTGTEYHYYILGEKFQQSDPKTLVISDVTGGHMIYFDGLSLAEVVNPTGAQAENIILNYAFVSYIYWNSTDAEAVIVQDERHGISMSPVTHAYLHKFLGAQYQSGLALGDFVIGAGTSNTHAQFSTATGVISDEDLPHTIDAVASTTGLTYLYRTGASGIWSKGTNAGYSFPVGATPLPQYNQYTGATWQLTEVGSGDYVNIFILVNGSILSKPYALVGTASYTTVTAASSGQADELTSLLPGLPLPEFVLIGAVIIEGKTSFTNSVNARVVQNIDGDNYTNYKTSMISGGNPPSVHNALSGLNIAETGEPFGHIDNDQPIQLPELTTTERDAVAGPNAGMIIYNTTLGEFQVYNAASQWENIFSSIGASVASATNLTPIPTADSFSVTGTTTINAIDTANWKSGRTIKLQFASACTITHDGTVSGDNKKIILKRGADYTTTANDVLILWYNGTSWYEVNNLTPFGSDNQIPVTNSAGNGFDYSADFTWTGKLLNLKATTGTDNIIIGSGSASVIEAGSSENILIGTDVAQRLTSGYANLVMGWFSGYAITTGYYNTIIGYNSGSGTGTSSNSNTIIGSFAGNAALGDNNVFIGYESGRYETGSNKLFIDNQNRTNEATSRTNSLIYGEFNSTPSSQLFRVNATLEHTTGNLGFYGATAVAQQTVTGSTGANAALQDLLTKLANLGLIVDSTT